MIATKYGTRVLHFGFGDALLGIEVNRQAAQRPLEVFASWLPLPIVNPMDDGAKYGLARLIVYRGSIAKENNGQIITLADSDWPTRLDNSGADVFADVLIPYLAPQRISFRDWPDEIVKSTPGASLGAAILQPVNMGTAVFINGIAVLTFVGVDEQTGNQGFKPA